MQIVFPQDGCRFNVPNDLADAINEGIRKGTITPANDPATRHVAYVKGQASRDKAARKAAPPKK